MNVLICGGAGYIGSHVARRFLDAGHEVTVFDNLSTGLRSNLQGGAEFFEGDILDMEALKKAMASGFDALVHLAAFKSAGESMLHPEKYAENNISGTINLLNAMSEAKIRMFIFSSSSAVYGEPDYLPVDENHPLKPTNFYGFTKLEIERLLEWYEKLRGLRFVSLRYFNAAGYDPQGRITGLEQNPTNLIPVVMEVAAGIREEVLVYGDDYDTPDGTGVRDYVHVSDLSEAHLSALNYLEENNPSLKVNLGTERGFSVMEVVRAARTVTGKDIPVEIVGRRAGDPARVYAGASLAKKLLGWDPRYRTIEGILDTHWKAYSANYS
ncbi:MAG: UDP-glucose 4-epimerase GalE [Nitrospinae bacterium]|nr:UDP-glucose 4-epimerase GalE [Nitrospinota bacterium]